MLVNNNYELIIVKDEKNLHEIINYLETNFKWTKKYSNSLFKLIVNNNLNKIFGIKLKSEFGETIGAILTIQQPHIISGSDSKEVINLSSWYIDKTWRGICGMAMAIKITQVFKNSIITNYTPSKNVISILKAIKFVEMINISLSSTFIDLLKIKSKNYCYEINKTESLYYDQSELDILNINKNSHLIRFDSKKVNFELIGIKTFVIKKIIIVPVIIPIFRILTISSTKLANDEWEEISKFIMSSKNVARVEGTFNLGIGGEQDLKYKIKKKETFLIRDLSCKNFFIYPLNSELSMSLSFLDQLSIITFLILRFLKLRK